MSAVVEAPVDLIEAIAALRFPEPTDRLMQQLMDRNNEGALTADEKHRLAGLVELSETLSLVRSQRLARSGTESSMTAWSELAA